MGDGREPYGELAVLLGVEGSLLRVLGWCASERRLPARRAVSCRSPALATASKMAAFAPASLHPMNASDSAAASLQGDEDSK